MSVEEGHQPAPELEVSYELTHEDARLAFSECLWGHPTTRRKLVIIFLVLLSALGAICAATGFLAVFVVALIAIVINFRFVIPRLNAAQVGRSPSFRGPHVARISPAATGGDTAGVGTTRLEWNQVDAVRSTPDYILLHWKSGCTTPVPRRAFASAADADEFLNKAREWHQAGRGAG